MSNNIKDSQVAATAVLYDNIRVFRSNVGEKCVIADGCDISNCRMSDCSEAGRRNQLKSVLFGRGTYTSTNCIIKNADIGCYCCIGPNVYAGGGNHNYGNVSLYTDYWWNRTFGLHLEEREKIERIEIGNDVWMAPV